MKITDLPEYSVVSKGRKATIPQEQVTSPQDTDGFA